jgi:hypothetical protein
MLRIYWVAEQLLESEEDSVEFSDIASNSDCVASSDCTLTNNEMEKCRGNG